VEAWLRPGARGPQAYVLSVKAWTSRPAELRAVEEVASNLALAAGAELRVLSLSPSGESFRVRLPEGREGFVYAEEVTFVSTARESKSVAASAPRGEKDR
jgi:hypothetical protein